MKPASANDPTSVFVALIVAAIAIITGCISFF